jgi:glycosyltransferase involved in cell wall biosynthesis
MIHSSKAKKFRENPYEVTLTASNVIAPFPRLERVARSLAQLGFRCLAIGWDRGGSLPRFEEGNGVDIARFSFFGEYGGGIRNLLGLFLFNCYLFITFLKIRPKVIHAYDLDTAIPAIFAKMLLGCKVVYDIADWYADSRKVGRLKWLVERLERWVCRRVDAVILAHEERLQQIGFEPRKWLVIYNTPEDRFGNFLSEMREEDYFAYVGVLYPDRGLEQITEASLIAGVRLVLAGFGSFEEYCREMTKKFRNIEFLGKIPYERTLEIERNALAIIALYDPNFRNNRLAAPNKLYEAMMLGRPLITNRGTLVGELVEKERIGVVVTYGDTQELAQALKQLRDNPEEREAMGRRARRLYEERYSFEKQAGRLREVYRELLSGFL